VLLQERRRKSNTIEMFFIYACLICHENKICGVRHFSPHFSQRFVYEATKMPAKSEVASGNKRGILDSMLSAISAETSFAAAFSKPQ
jgi:hypothetical protein